MHEAEAARGQVRRRVLQTAGEALGQGGGHATQLPQGTPVQGRKPRCVDGVRQDPGKCRVGDSPLHPVRTALQDRPPLQAGAADELVGQPGLSDPRLSGEEDEAVPDPPGLGPP